MESNGWVMWKMGFVLTIATAYPVLATATVSQIDAWDLRKIAKKCQNWLCLKMLG